MHNNCKTIWGDHCNYDIFCETGDHEYWIYYVKEDFDFKFGEVLLLISPIRTEEAACDEMERMLAFGAREKPRQRTTV
jgi:hypothetical protein